MPCFFSCFLLRFNEMRTFHVHETIQRQQRLVLEIFERQNEGVIIVKNAKSDDQKKERVVYSNNAFKQLYPCQDEAGFVDTPFLVQKLDESKPLEVQQLPNLSVKSLLAKSVEFLSNNIFTWKKMAKPEEQDAEDRAKSLDSNGQPVSVQEASARYYSVSKQTFDYND